MELTFENAMKELETIVKRLENGGNSLDDSFRDFEEALALVKYCNATLESCEQKIHLLMGDSHED